MQVVQILVVAESVIAITLAVALTIRYFQVKHAAENQVADILSYQRGDMDPWDPKFLDEKKKRKRHGYTFDARYHEDPWDIGEDKW